MSTEIKKDELTGLPTTGHDWDGLTEINQPLPRWWLYVLYASIIWAIGYWIVMPAWPLISSHTKGVIGYSQRQVVLDQMATARAAQSQWVDQIDGAEPAAVLDDPDLLRFAMAGGAAAFGDNCAPCHGSGASGSPGYPNLNDDDWLWGGDIDTIYSVIRHGIRSPTDEETRISDMPPFKTFEMLVDDEVNDTAEYVLSLTGAATDEAAAGRGETLFADNCAACHGEQGEGLADLGAPRLNDAIWLYGSDKDTIVDIISYARAGHMPAWAGRLDDATIKQLAVYVHALGGGQ